ncbi:hypothetical protein ABZ318_02795 [Streptomyces sp. NPDC006197]|uniref:hypothetical protein n=1 Tax=Streptomyces sp. NPDC006197 TaxID=3156685 RepID=UPI0033A5CC0B
MQSATRAVAPEASRTGRGAHRGDRPQGRQTGVLVRPAGRANWWAPAPLKRLHARFGIAD